MAQAVFKFLIIGLAEAWWWKQEERRRSQFLYEGKVTAKDEIASGAIDLCTKHINGQLLVLLVFAYKNNLVTNWLT